jgi:hypothetical protein
LLSPRSKRFATSGLVIGGEALRGRFVRQARDGAGTSSILPYRAGRLFFKIAGCLAEITPKVGHYFYGFQCYEDSQGIYPACPVDNGPGRPAVTHL